MELRTPTPLNSTDRQYGHRDENSLDTARNMKLTVAFRPAVAGRGGLMPG